MPHSFLAQDSRHLVKDLVVELVDENPVQVYSDPVEMNNFTGAAVQYVISDVSDPVSGTLKLQESNDGENWTDIASASASITGAGSGMITVKDNYADKIRISYTGLVGSATVNCFVQAKGK